MVFPGGGLGFLFDAWGVEGLWSFGHKLNPYSIIGEGDGQVLRKKGMDAARRPRTTLSAI